MFELLVLISVTFHYVGSTALKCIQVPKVLKHTVPPQGLNRLVCNYLFKCKGANKNRELFFMLRGEERLLT